MPDATDIALVREYCARQSEPAFETLVHRHVNLVYSTALRRVGNPAQAEEITQAVFIILARKAARLRPDAVLAAWLHETARHVAASFLRGEIRRRRREQEAYTQSTLQPSSDDSAWEQLAPLLDEAIGRLGTADRNVVALRYFQNKSAQEIAAVLNIGEAAAKKRLARAVEKLRRDFFIRGINVSTAALSGAVLTHSVQAAPAALAKTVTAVALAKGATAPISTLTLIQGALKIMAWSKAKTAIISGVCILLAAGTTTITVKEIQKGRTYPWQAVVPPNSEEAVKALDTALPQVTIVRSKFLSNHPSGSLWDDAHPKEQWRYIGIHTTTTDLVIRAYQEGFPLLPSQIIFPSNMPNGFYDFIANLTNGSQQALQELIKKKFGLVGKYELRNMDAFSLEVDRPNASGLKPAMPMTSGQPQPPQLVSQGLFHYKNLPISRLAKDLGWNLQIPVIDQTGLAGNYDFDFPETLGATPDEKLQQARQWLLNQLGLELVPTNMPVEMLVVEKVK